MKMRYTVLVLMLAILFSAAPHAADARVSSPNQSFKKALVSLANSDRRASGVKVLSENKALSAAAQKKADDMAAKGYFAHYSPTGASPWQWILSAGYDFSHAGENIAVNFDDPSTLEAEWMASPEHHDNIVRSLYTQVGIGVAHGTYLGKPTTFVVQFFATPAQTRGKGSTRASAALTASKASRG